MSMVARLSQLRFSAVAIGRQHFFTPVQASHTVTGDEYPLSVAAFGLKWHFSQRKRDELDLSLIKLLFITVPVYQLEPVMNQIAPQLPPGSVVVSLCNGRCDPILWRVQSTYNHLQVRQGVAFYNCTPRSTYELVCSNTGYVVWGPMDNSSPCPICPIEAELERTDKEYVQAVAVDDSPFLRYAADVTAFYHNKWIINTTINTLAGAYSLYGGRQVVSQLKPTILHQTFAEAYALGQKIWGQLQVSPHHLNQFMLTMLHEFGDTEISMHRHLRLGKRTESAYLAGQALTWPQEFPWLCKLHARICAAELRALRQNGGVRGT